MLTLHDPHHPDAVCCERAHSEVLHTTADCAAVDGALVAARCSVCDLPWGHGGHPNCSGLRADGSRVAAHAVEVVVMPDGRRLPLEYR